mmetsp:Transcript_31554/g.50333  ORF Transcript_31554/g.50333 Transcript_31554/m.50333 type:complete len:731 (-) Transcript_31554:155-2347(-)
MTMISRKSRQLFLLLLALFATDVANAVQQCKGYDNRCASVNTEQECIDLDIDECYWDELDYSCDCIGNDGRCAGSSRAECEYWIDKDADCSLKCSIEPGSIKFARTIAANSSKPKIPFVSPGHSIVINGPPTFNSDEPAVSRVHYRGFDHLRAFMAKPGRTRLVAAAKAATMIPYSVMTASQSSEAHGGGASKALTTTADGDWPGTCTHTHSDDQQSQWWKVSLIGLWTITSVTLTNRADCCPERLQGVDIYVGSTVCATGVSVAAGATLSITCHGTGSEIKIQQTSSQYLTICGFRAYGRQAQAPVAEIDFSSDSQSNTPYVLKDGAQILTAPGGFRALRIDKDGQYALIPGVNINPSAMPACTLMIGLYVESFANNRGWVFGHEESGYDRTILVNDDRYGGGVASAVGKMWTPWTDASKGKVPIKQWVLLTAVFRQNGDSYVYLNGIRSDSKVIATNNEGSNDLYVGRPKGWSNHWVDSWIKEVKVFDQALTDGSIADYAKIFLSEASGVSGDTQGLASRSATDIWYSGCQQVDDLNQVLANVDGQMYGMTIGACFAKCKKKRGMKYFALTNGDQCLCSVTPPGQDIDEGSCNKKCSGKSNEICGGDSINIASVYTMVNCAPLPSSELDAEYKDALADLYEVWEGESCGKSDDNLCEIKGSAKMAADLKECKLACWEEQGSDKCNGFTYDKATSECTFYQDVLDGTVTKGPQLACFFKKLGYPLNLRE